MIKPNIGFEDLPTEQKIKMLKFSVETQVRQLFETLVELSELSPDAYWCKCEGLPGLNTERGICVSVEIAD